MTRLHRFGFSLLARLIVGYLLVAAVFAAAWLWSLYGPLTDAALRRQERNLTVVAQGAALVAKRSGGDVAELARDLVAHTDLQLTIIDTDGTVLADSQVAVDVAGNQSRKPEVIAALRGETGIEKRVSRITGIEELYVAVPTTIQDTRAVLRVAQPLSEIEEIAASSRRFGLWLLAFALAVAAAVSVAAARAAAAPVRDLTFAARRMAAGDLAVPVPEMPSDLADLARSLSELRSQVQARLEALETERRTLRSTLDGLADTVLVVEKGVVLVANRQADRMFRAPEGGWEGALLRDAHLPGPLASALDEARGSTSVVSLDLAPDPTGLAFRLVVRPLDSGASQDRSIVVISDITERTRLDSVRRDFVANASHELKTPTSGIRLLAQAAESAAVDGDAELSLSFTRQIEAETERLQYLVSDLLDLSRLESTASDDAMADIREALDRALMSHRPAAARKGLALSVDMDVVRGGDVFVHADATDVAIALDNLLDNAISYTEHGSVHVSVAVTEAAVRIAVTDTGPGIDLAHQSRIFERFYRVDRGRSRDAGGTGLGLALVRHVAERAGGSVTLTSAPDEGSTFTLSLPRAI